MEIAKTKLTNNCIASWLTVLLSDGIPDPYAYLIPSGGFNQ